MRIPILEAEEENRGIKFFLDLNKNGDVIFTHKLYKINELPLSIWGPTSTEIKKFEEEHPDALPCPHCGYRYYVAIWGVYEAYDPLGGEGFCRVCDLDPDFPHKVRSSCQKVIE